MGTTIFVTLALVLIDALAVKTAPWAMDMSPLVRDGILPLLVISVLTAGGVLILRKRYGSPLNETVQALFVAMMTALMVLTVIGVFLRGPSMRLVWPV
jgi:hypothetical protein